MESASAAQRPQWSWPRDTNPPPSGDSAGASSSADTRPGTDDSTRQRPQPPPSSQQQQQQQRHYRPRTCRICLDVVYPTTEMDDSAAAGLFGAKPRVRYVSEDPDLGRLLSPCRCRGSQKFVHEGCLQAWRRSAPLSDRNFWRCPTCHFEYRMERLRWGRWLASRWMRAALTALVMLIAVFLLGFVADPIINLWLDPIGSIAEAVVDADGLDDGLDLGPDDEPVTWSYHLLKGLFSLGLLGFVKSLFAMSPWQWFNIRFGGGGGLGGRRRGAGGRDRLESINWAFILIGLITFIGATWKLISHISSRVLESASERVVDVQGDNDEEEDDDDDTGGGGVPPRSDPPSDSRKDT